MECNRCKDELLDLLQQGEQPAAPLAAHLAQCAECARVWQALRASYQALDQWQAPEPSPFFDTRMQALLREAREQEAQPQGLLGWFRRPLMGFNAGRPVLAGALALAMAFAVGLNVASNGNEPQLVQNTPAARAQGTAVSDLQTLEKNQDLYSDFDLLDELPNDHTHPGEVQSGAQDDI